ncbi:MAG TPA: hypothetical protein VGG41_07275 [Solirubrobacteraceae bacterium]
MRLFGPLPSVHHFPASAAVFSTGDYIALGGILVALLLYWFGQSATTTHDVQAARALLSGVRAGMASWGDLYFAHPYTEDRMNAMAQTHYDYVINFTWGYIYEIPTQPVAALVGGAAATSWISEETVAAAGAALWQMDLFNAIARQHNALARQHLAEIVDRGLPEDRRRELATAAHHSSYMVHKAIGPATWYPRLREALRSDVTRLDERLARPDKRFVRYLQGRRRSQATLPIGPQGGSATPPNVGSRDADGPAENG